MTVAHVIGIDPGLVDTGCVSMTFRPLLRQVEVEHLVVPGPDVDKLFDWVYHASRPAKQHVFVEKYTPRLKLDSDQRMVQAETELRRAIPEATFLPNTGVKRVIPQSLMDVFGVWSWPTVTHHQDLRSAARIALLGMVKDRTLNALMADVVRDHLEGRPWQVAHV